jgi:hypothetical protein
MATKPSPTNAEASETISCSICAKPVDPKESIVEERPTGESFSVEDWYYCVDCWISMKRLRQRQINPEVLLSVLEL